MESWESFTLSVQINFDPIEAVSPQRVCILSYDDPPTNEQSLAVVVVFADRNMIDQTHFTAGG
uniref:AlNc14C573G12187 protein n=1 Tax=Albugo laibachii Nc14 TaxID=890382 RepID=F0X192_9STRA|nr:AlNc14C573G12187 [Albugo laibachii Nc14]|eukprot:CCA27552.1 AlNc14C573G12187 [Albugo laibachii Nc14]